MNVKKLQYICCPQCKSDLVMFSDDLLVCKLCSKNYSIQEGIPILVDLMKLTPHLRGQVKYFEKESKQKSDYKLDEWQKSYIRRLNANFRLNENDVILDIGTGSGYVAVEMARKGLIVLACDLTFAKLIRLKNIAEREHLNNNLFLVCCSAESLPFKHVIVDYAVSNAVLEHLPNESAAIDEMVRVCKKKSGLMITVPLKLKYVYPIFWLINYVHDRRIGHLRRYTDDVLFSKFKKFGYKVINVYHTGHFIKVLCSIIAFLGLKSIKLDKWAEIEDGKKEHNKYGASNVCCILERLN